MAKKAWLSYTHDTKPIWDYSDVNRGIKPKVITFYSFKGGMGRTTALTAVSLHLALHGKNVLAIDADIEAPGLASLFFQESRIKNGIVDYFLEPMFANGKAANIKDYIVEVSKANRNGPLLEGIPGRIFIIPAGVLDNEYIQKLSRIDYKDTHPGSMRDNISWLVDDALKYITRKNKVNIDYILLDARSGFNDMSGVITAQLPHGVVLFGRDTAQSWSGLRQVIIALANVQSTPLNFAIVNSVCSKNDLEQENRESFKQAVNTMIGEIYPEVWMGSRSEYTTNAPLYIPYSDDLNCGFKLYLGDSPEDSESIAFIKSLLLQDRYADIARRICGWFDDNLGTDSQGGALSND